MAQHCTKSSIVLMIVFSGVPENRWSIFLLKARCSVFSDLLMCFCEVLESE